MAKARAGFHGPVGLGINQLLRGTGGPEYIASLLTGFTGEERELAGAVLYGNTAFAGGWISMAPPLERRPGDLCRRHRRRRSSRCRSTSPRS